jgi:alpha-tubulin suppressor-like RCC1 family protein
MKSGFFHAVSNNFPSYGFFNSAEALSENQEKKLKKMKGTEVYMWGNGYQVDSSQDYSNFSPKRLKSFSDPKQPHIIDISFGWFHEAYIDAKGRLFVCKKHRMSSIQIEEINDKGREGLI